MSIENGKVCCNCRHCIRKHNVYGFVDYCYCDIDDWHLSYEQVMTRWCRHWSTNAEKWKKEDEQ